MSKYSDRFSPETLKDWNGFFEQNQLRPGDIYQIDFNNGRSYKITMPEIDYRLDAQNEKDLGVSYISWHVLNSNPGIGYWESHKDCVKKKVITIGDAYCEKVIAFTLVSKNTNSQTNPERTTRMNRLIQKGKQLQQLILPYKKYIIALAVIVVIDHFLLKGKYRIKMQEFISAIGDRCVTVIDNLIKKIGE